MAKLELIEKLTRKLGIISIKDLRKNGVHPEKMRRLA